MDAVSGLFLNALGTDMVTMEEYFPFITKAFDIMQYTAWAVLFLIVVWQLFRAFGGPITEAENPWQLVVRGAIFALLIGYAKPIFMLALDIIKTTSDGKKEGFAFRITGANGYDMTFTTDAKGEIFIEKLRIGEYTVTELKNSASEGYKIADPVKITLVANETLTVKIHNDKTKVDVPKTGDDADLMLWISLLGLTAAGVGCTAFFYLKKRRTGKHIAVKK